jgi:hypothetical protein
MSGPAKFCRKCGMPLPEDSTFCPKCGTPVLVSATTTPLPSSGPTYGRRREKGEKHEKREKNEKNEKGNEKRGEEGGLLGALVGGSIVIWLGVTFYLQQLGYLASNDWWAYFIVGIGVILVLEGGFLFARGRRGLGPIIGGAVLIFIGGSSILNAATNAWPLILVAIGVAVIVGGFAARRRVPSP